MGTKEKKIVTQGGVLMSKEEKGKTGKFERKRKRERESKKRKYRRQSF
jgi:hypothetical protein